MNQVPNLHRTFRCFEGCESVIFSISRQYKRATRINMFSIDGLNASRLKISTFL